jgi:cbb3-type cytochrome oxidase subunit 3
MFERVQFDEWQTIITIVAFLLCFSAFIHFCWRAIRMSRHDQRHLSNLPLESEEEPEISSHERSPKN